MAADRRRLSRRGGGCLVPYLLGLLVLSVVAAANRVTAGPENDYNNIDLVAGALFVLGLPLSLLGRGLASAGEGWRVVFLIGGAWLNVLVVVAVVSRRSRGRGHRRRGAGGGRPT